MHMDDNHTVMNTGMACCSFVLCFFIFMMRKLQIQIFFFFKQKTAYEMIWCWSSDVCSSDLAETQGVGVCRAFAVQMGEYFAQARPDLVVMSADWLENARPPRFAGMVRDLRRTIGRLREAGIPVVLFGP